VGYSVDLCKTVADGIRDQLKLPTLQIEWVKLNIGNRFSAVRDGTVDVQCGATTWTLSRQEYVDFSLMTFIDGGTVMVNSDSDAKTIHDLNGKRIAVVPGTTTEKALTDALRRRQIQAEVVKVGSPERGMKLLSQHQVDGYASDRLVLLGLGLDTKGGKGYHLLTQDFSIEPYALALPKGEYDLRLAVNRSLAALYRSGGIEAVFDRWLAQYGNPSVLLSALYYLQGIPE